MGLKALQDGGFNFAHVDFFARKVSAKKSSAKSKGKQWTASDIASEAMRDAGNCPHVMNPLPPKILYGVGAHEAVSAGYEWAANTKDSLGRGIRSDAPIMSAGVVSLPRERETEWDAFKLDVVDALKRRYGDRLLSIVEHLDEEHPHLHFYLVPLPTDKDFIACHNGYAARLRANRDKKKPAEQKHEYRAAMIEWQDWAYQAFGEKWGLSRVGPRRQRLDRLSYLLEKNEALFQKLSAKEGDLTKNEQDFLKERGALEAEKLLLESRERTISVAQGEIQATREQAEAAKKMALGMVKQSKEKLERVKKASSFGSLAGSAIAGFTGQTRKAKLAQQEVEKLKKQVAQEQAKRVQEVTQARNAGIEQGKQSAAFGSPVFKTLVEQEQKNERLEKETAQLQLNLEQERREKQKAQQELKLAQSILGQNGLGYK